MALKKLRPRKLWLRMSATRSGMITRKGTLKSVNIPVASILCQKNPAVGEPGVNRFT
jgi:hypothetical protein